VQYLFCTAKCGVRTIYQLSNHHFTLKIRASSRPPLLLPSVYAFFYRVVFSSLLFPLRAFEAAFFLRVRHISPKHACLVANQHSVIGCTCWQPSSRPVMAEISNRQLGGELTLPGLAMYSDCSHLPSPCSAFKVTLLYF
jgi:hypothetical protein